MDAKVHGWYGLLNVTELMQPYCLQPSYPLINVHGGKAGLSYSQERFNGELLLHNVMPLSITCITEVSTQSPSPWNYTWIVPLRTAQYSSPVTKVHWLVPDRFDGVFDSLVFNVIW